MRHLYIMNVASPSLLQCVHLLHVAPVVTVGDITTSSSFCVTQNRGLWKTKPQQNMQNISYI